MTASERAKPPVLVTGATSGLGRKITLSLAQSGWPLIVAGRREQAVMSLCETCRSHGVDAREFVADLTDLKSVQNALSALIESDPALRLGGIITNAGITTRENAQTAQGFEITFGVNVLAHELILQCLASRVREGGRIVVLSSGVHEPDNKLARRAGIPVPDWLGTRELALLNAESPRSEFSGPRRYSTSKLGNVLQARNIQQQLTAQGRRIDVFALDPGLMVDTDLARELPAIAKPVFRGLGRLLTPFVDNMRLSDVSAAHVLSLIEDSQWAGKGFSYLDGNRIKAPSADGQRDDLLKEFAEETANLLAGFGLHQEQNAA